MNNFKQYFDPARIGIDMLYSAITSGTVKLKLLQNTKKYLLWDGIWEWGEGIVYLQVSLYGEEIEIDLYSNGFMYDGTDIVKWDTLLPERVSQRIHSYFQPKVPNRQPDTKAGTVELEAWLESPTVAKQIKNMLRNAKSRGFKYFNSREEAENYGRLI